MKEIEQINTGKITEEQLKGEFNYSQSEISRNRSIRKGLQRPPTGDIFSGMAVFLLNI